MPKLSKTAALDLLSKTVDDSSTVNDVDARELRAMTYAEREQKAASFAATLVNNVRIDTRLVADAQRALVVKITRIWDRLVDELERTDPEIRAEIEVLSFDRRVETMLTDAAATLAKFRANFETNPAYALEWSLGAFQAAANLDVATRAKAERDAGADVAKLKAQLARDAANRCRIDGSTSPASNLVERARIVAGLELAGIKGY